MQVQPLKNSLKLVAQNDFNAASAESLISTLLEALAATDRKEIMLVFNEKEMLDEAGLKVLYGLSQECEQRDMTLNLRVKSANALELIRLCRLDERISVQEA